MALALSGLSAATPATAQTASPHAVSWTRSCAAPTAANTMACDALHVTGVPEHLNAKGATPNATPAGYGPSDLLSAYNLAANGGAGQTVAVVDAYNDPNAESDLGARASPSPSPRVTAATAWSTRPPPSTSPPSAAPR